MRGRLRGRGRRVGVRPAEELHRRADRRASSVSNVVRKEFAEVVSPSPESDQFHGSKPVAVSPNVSVTSVPFNNEIAVAAEEVSSHIAELSVTATGAKIINADPLWNCRRPGSVSRFWVDSDDEESGGNSLPTLDVVPHNFVHGFSVNDMTQVNDHLTSPTFRLRALGSTSPAPDDKPAVLARRIVSAFKARPSTKCAQRLEKLPSPRLSPKITLGDCMVHDLRGRSNTIGRRCLWDVAVEGRQEAEGQTDFTNKSDASLCQNLICEPITEKPRHCLGEAISELGDGPKAGVAGRRKRIRDGKGRILSRKRVLAERFRSEQSTLFVQLVASSVRLGEVWKGQAEGLASTGMAKVLWPGTAVLGE